MGALVSTWFGDAPPANVSPSNHTHHHYPGAATPLHVSKAAIVHNVPTTTESSVLGLAETWVGPSQPSNVGLHHSHSAGHKFPQQTHESNNPLDVGHVTVTPSNSIFGLASSWSGPTPPSNQGHDHHGHGK